MNLCECKCKFDGRKCDLKQKWNNDKCQCERKNPKEHNACEKDYIWSPAIYSCEKTNYLASAIGDSVITCDEIINAADSASTNVPDVTSIASINFHSKKVRYSNRLLYSTYAFASGHITIYNRYYLLSLCKT